MAALEETVQEQEIPYEGMLHVRASITKPDAPTENLQVAEANGSIEDSPAFQRLRASMPPAQPTTASDVPQQPASSRPALEDSPAFQRLKQSVPSVTVPTGVPTTPPPSPLNLAARPQVTQPEAGATPVDLFGGAKRTLAGSAVGILAQGLGLPVDLLNNAMKSLVPTLASQYTLAPAMTNTTPEEFQAQAQAQAPQLPGGAGDITAAARTLLSEAGFDPHELLDPQGGVERVAQKILTQAGAAALPFTTVNALARWARLPISAFPGLAASLGADGSVLDALIRATPVQLQGFQALYGATGAIGEEAVAHAVATPTAPAQDQHAARAIGQVLGTLAPGAIKGVLGLVRSLTQSRNNPAQLKPLVEQGIADYLREVPTAQQNLTEAQAIKDAVPGFQPSLAQAVPTSTGVARTQREALAQEPIAQRRLLQEEANRAALVQHAEQSVLDATEGATLADTQAAAQAQRDALLAQQAREAEQATRLAQDAEAQLASERHQIMREAQRVTQAADRHADEVRTLSQQTQLQTQAVLDRVQNELRQATSVLQGPESVLADTGATTRQALQEAFLHAKTQASKLYRAVDPNHEAVDMVGDLYSQLSDIARRATESGLPVPPSVQRTLRAIDARAARLALGEAVATPLATVAETALPDTDVTLATFIRRKGGISVVKSQADVRRALSDALRPREQGTTGLLNNQTGRSVDSLIEEAQQAGFLGRDEGVNELLAKIGDDLAGRPQYSSYHSHMDDILRERLGAEGGYGDELGLALTPDEAAARAEAVKGVPIEYMELHQLQSKIGSAVRQEANPEVRRILSQAKAVIDRKMDLVAESPFAPPDLAGRRQAAQQFYRENVVPFYGETPGAKILQQENGFYKIPNEQVLQQFWTTLPQGGQTRIDAFEQLLGGSRDAREALTTYAMHDLYVSAQKDGVFDLAKAEQWRERHATQLRLFPEVEAQFDTARELAERFRAVKTEADIRQSAAVAQAQQADAAAAAALKREQAVQAAVQPTARPVVPEGGQAATSAESAAQAAQERLAPLSAQVGEAQTALEARLQEHAAQRAQFDQRIAAQFLGGDPQAAMQRILGQSVVKQRQALAEAAQQVADSPAAQRGLLRGLWDAYLEKQPRKAEISGLGAALNDPTILRKFVNEYHEFLTSVGGVDFAEDLRIIAHAVDMTQRRVLAQQGPGLVTELGAPSYGRRAMQSGMPLLGLLGAELAGSAVGIPRTYMGHLAEAMVGFSFGEKAKAWMQAGGLARQEAVAQLLEESLFTPDFAHFIRLLQSPKATPQQLNALYHIHLLRLGRSTDDEERPNAR